MLPERPKKGNFMDHMAPNQLHGLQNVSVETQFHRIKTRERNDHQEFGAFPCVWDEKDYQVECSMGKRLQRGGATFRPKNIMFEE